MGTQMQEQAGIAQRIPLLAADLEFSERLEEQGRKHEGSGPTDGRAEASRLWSYHQARRVEPLLLAVAAGT